MNLPSERIVRKKLSDEVFTRLKQLIENGELKAGDDMPSERELMERFGVGRPAIREAMQALAGKVFVEDSVLDYILKIITATRTEAEFKAGVSVRGGLALRIAAQARALLLGRDFVIPEDIQETAGAVLAHRLSLARQTSDAMEERRTVLASLRRIIAAVPVPE